MQTVLTGTLPKDIKPENPLLAAQYSKMTGNDRLCAYIEVPIVVVENLK